VIASNPPIFPGLIALLYAKLARVPFVLDSHTGSFGLKGDRVSRLLLPAHAWLTRRAAATLVAADELAERVRTWGGRPQVLHEAPPRWEVAPPAPLGDPPTVLVVSTFDHDEAVEHVVEAARLAPEIAFRLTGDLRKCPREVRESLPANIELVGFLRGDDYVRAVASADFVMALTTEPRSVVRAGYEAVYARRPLVVSDWPVLRDVFPYATHVENAPDAIATGLRAAIARHAELREAAPVALELQRGRWDRQLATLQATLASPSTDARVALGTQG
jgi:glycosyltransferase involved in cell wall biosynthesis